VTKLSVPPGAFLDFLIGRRSELRHNLLAELRYFFEEYLAVPVRAIYALSVARWSINLAARF
jgi:hypothetical protein